MGIQFGSPSYTDTFVHEAQGELGWEGKQGQAKASIWTLVLGPQMLVWIWIYLFIYLFLGLDLNGWNKQTWLPSPKSFLSEREKYSR